jgi:glycosidase
MSYIDIADNGGYGTNTSFNAKNGRRDYPDVPYDASHFHDSICNSIIKDEDWLNDYPVYNCRLANLADLKTEDSYVRKNIIDFLNNLLDIGVVGFRTDASKAVPYADWQAIFSGLKNTYRGSKFLKKSFMHLDPTTLTRTINLLAESSILIMRKQSGMLSETLKVKQRIN